MIDTLAIVFGLILIFLAFSIILIVICVLADSCLFERLAKICLAITVILFAVALLLLVGVGVEGFVTFSEGSVK